MDIQLNNLLNYTTFFVVRVNGWYEQKQRKGVTTTELSPELRLSADVTSDRMTYGTAQETLLRQLSSLG